MFANAGINNDLFDSVRELHLKNKQELSDVGPFRLLAACLRGNRTLTSLTLNQLHPQLMETLAIALRGNLTLRNLTLVSSMRTGGQTTVDLPLPQLLGTWDAKSVKSFAWQNPSTVFQTIDEDGSGGVAIGELANGLQDHGLDLTTSQTRALHRECDTDGDGRVGWLPLSNKIKNLK